MIKIENVEVMGWEHAIRGMRNPMNSWENSDSYKCPTHCSSCPHVEMGTEPLKCHTAYYDYCVGQNDYELMRKLIKAGADHRKFMRMITVYMDVTAPLYWWKEFDTYKVSTVRNSCSTMHKIMDKEFSIDDFSHDKVINYILDELKRTIIYLNGLRADYLSSKNKEYWYSLIQLLPSSYNQKATVMLNYEVLRNIYHSRKNHKLDEWVEFCKMIKNLPYGKELICI